MCVCVSISSPGGEGLIEVRRRQLNEKFRGVSERGEEIKLCEGYFYYNIIIKLYCKDYMLLLIKLYTKIVVNV